MWQKRYQEVWPKYQAVRIVVVVVEVLSIYSGSGSRSGINTSACRGRIGINVSASRGRTGIKWYSSVVLEVFTSRASWSS